MTPGWDGYDDWGSGPAAASPPSGNSYPPAGAHRGPRANMYRDGDRRVPRSTTDGWGGTDGWDGRGNEDGWDGRGNADRWDGRGSTDDWDGRGSTHGRGSTDDW